MQHTQAEPEQDSDIALRRLIDLASEHNRNPYIWKARIVNPETEHGIVLWNHISTARVERAVGLQRRLEKLLKAQFAESIIPRAEYL